MPWPGRPCPAAPPSVESPWPCQRDPTPGGKLAIGEWFPSQPTGMAGREPEVLKAQMAAAGYVFERMETFLQGNGMNIYLFTVK